MSFRDDLTQFDDYGAGDLSQMAPDLNEVGIKMIEVQHKPDLRIHCVRNDGKVAVLVLDSLEEVMCWLLVETDGEVEDVSVLPGTKEDRVYYVVKHGSQRFVTKWAMERECRGATVNKQADFFVLYEGAATTTITGLTHLNGEAVVVWADGKDVTEYDSSGNVTGPVVSGGQITLSTAAANVVVGRQYIARYKSARTIDLDAGLHPNQRRLIQQVGFTLINTHHKGLRYGSSFDKLYDLPQKVQGKTVATDHVWDELEDDLTAAGSGWTVDERLCLEARAPRPCTITAAVMDIETSEK